MSDYKSLYLHMAHASEEAIRILITAQQECEQMLLNSEEPPPIVILPSSEAPTNSP